MNKQLLQEIERVREIMGIIPDNNLLIENKFVTELFEKTGIVKFLTQYIDDLVRILPDGKLKLNWDDLVVKGVQIDEVAKKNLDDFVLVSNKAVDDGTWNKMLGDDLSKTIGKDPEALIRNIIKDGASLPEKLGFFRVVSALDGNFDKFVKAIKGNDDFMELMVSVNKLGKVTVDDVAGHIYGKKASELLPNHLAIVNKIFGGLDDSIIKFLEPNLLSRAGTKFVDKVITWKTFRWILAGFLAGTAYDEFSKRWSGYELGDVIGDGDYGKDIVARVTNAFDIDYWKQMKRGKTPKWIQKETLSPGVLQSLYTKMTAEMDTWWGVDEGFIADFWADPRNDDGTRNMDDPNLIRTIIQASQYSAYYQSKAGSPLLRGLVDGLGIPLKGTVTQFIMDLFRTSDDDEQMVISHIATLDVALGDGTTDILTQEDLEKIMWINMPYYKRERKDNSDNVWCCIVEDAKIPVDIVMACIKWCGSSLCGPANSSAGEKIDKMPLAKFNDIHYNNTGHRAYQLRPDGVSDCSDVPPKLKVSVADNAEATKEAGKYLWEKLQSGDN